MAVVPGGEFRIEPGGLLLAEVFDTDLQRPPDTVERISLAAPVAQGLLLDPAADLVDHGGSQFHAVERVQDGDRFGHLVADSVGVAAKRVQRRGLDTRGEPSASVLEPVSVSLPRPARNGSSNLACIPPFASRVWSTIPVTTPDPGGPMWDQTCSSTPSAFTPDSRSGIPMRRMASALMASNAVCQEAPS